ncbi:unnamed protein product [Microthlaspi erraticum]|uniref:RWP-RK domain-containing protein n=1 Tax=Microthlaspi erraticum TaxID=1685480 RepID=A0A6D2HPY3_9BRAS|nr:unnamed protein product [Microthlaspi erraticum]
MSGGGDSLSSTVEDNVEEYPYYDPLEGDGLFSEEDLRNVMADSNPSLMDIDFNQNPLPLVLPLPPSPPPPLAPSMEITETGLSQELSYNNDEEFLGPPFGADDLLISWDMFDEPSDGPNNSVDTNVLGDIGDDIFNDMFDLPSDDLNDNMYTNVLGEMGDDNFLGNDMFDILSDNLDDNMFNNVLGETGDDNFLGEIDYDNVLGDFGNDDVLGEVCNNVGDDNGRLEVSTRVFRENGVNFETGGPSSAARVETGGTSSAATPVPVITPPITGGILLCNCCNILRSLVHANGNEMMRLELYGGIGSFCHAVLETRLFVDSLEPRHQTIHLTGLTMEEVRKFIETYCLARQEDGFVVVQDSNAEFYQALNACYTSNQPPMPSLPSRGDVPMSLTRPDEALNVPPVPQYVGLRNAPTASLKEREKRKTPLAKQRERTGKMTLKDVGHYFHLPIEEAARRLSLCPTVMKKICRKGGLPRWPHRKIKSMLKKISTLKNALSNTKNEKIRKHAEEEIAKLEKEINEICSEALRRYK